MQRVVNSWAQRYAPRTVHRHYDVVSAIMNLAVLEDLVARTPCRGIKLPAVRHADRHIVTADELNALADALGPDYGLMAYLGAVLGLRQAECAGLRVGRIDFLATRSRRWVIARSLANCARESALSEKVSA